jgi:hypothetical protein
MFKRKKGIRSDINFLGHANATLYIVVFLHLMWPYIGKAYQFLSTNPKFTALAFCAVCIWVISWLMGWCLEDSQRNINQEIADLREEENDEEETVEAS